MNISLSAFAPENLVSRHRFGSPVPRQRAHLHTQAESGAYLRDSSRVPWHCPFIYFKPPYAIGPVPSLLGHAIAYRWRSLPRARRHKASKPQGSSKRVLPWHITMDQLICASLSHTHYWYEVGILKVPATCMVRHIARVWINWVRLSILLVVSWTGKMNISMSAFAPENLASRDGFGSPVPHQPAHLHTEAECATLFVSVSVCCTYCIIFVKVMLGVPAWRLM